MTLGNRAYLALSLLGTVTSCLHLHVYCYSISTPLGRPPCQRFCGLLFFACFVLDARLVPLPALELLLSALANSSLPFPFFHILPSALTRRSSSRFLSLPESFCFNFFPATDSGPFNSALPAFFETLFSFSLSNHVRFGLAMISFSCLTKFSPLV